MRRFTLFYALGIVFFSWPGTLIAQTELNGSWDRMPQKGSNTEWNAMSMKRHVTALALEVETGSPLNIGWSISYYFNPDGKRKYYVGLKLKGLVCNETRSIAPPIRSYNTSGGSMDSRWSAGSFDFIQRYFLKTNVTTIPFLYLDLGYRFSSSSTDISYSWDSGFPFGWLPGGDWIEISNTNAFSIDVGAGYYFRIAEPIGLYLKAGITTTGKFQYLNLNSVHYDDQGIQYNTNYSDPVFMTFSLGFTFSSLHLKRHKN